MSDSAPAPATGRSRRLPVALLIVALAVAAMTAWFTLAREDGARAAAPQSLAVPVTEIPPPDRKAPANVAGVSLAGEPLDIAQFRGQPVVLNVWGSWCAPCREEAPELKAVAAEFAGRAQFIGINVRDSAPPARAFERNYGITYPSIDDSDGKVLLSLSASIPPQAIPSTIILDSQGRVAASVIGKVREATLRALLTTVAAEQPAP